MLTPELLTHRLKTWSSQVTTAVSPNSPAPIALYQHLFALMHDLKTSVHLSESAAIRKLSTSVAASDVVLRRLAYGDTELSGAESENLYQLACNLDSLEPLEVFLTKVIVTAKIPAPVEPALLEEPYPWDSLSRARARSCARYDYSFHRREDVATLRGLPALEILVQQQTRAMDGLLIVRKLDAGGSQGSELSLTTNFVAAFPANSTTPPAPWLPL